MSTSSIQQLADLVALLRSPDGCPWDRQQTLADARAYLLEEAHEVAAAIDTADLDQLAGELGDLFFQSVFVSALVGEAGGESLAGILERIHTKMVERHPHVFGDHTLSSAEEVNRAWESRKARQTEPGDSILDGVPVTLPSLLAAYRMTQKASGVGFDWPDTRGVLAKIREELEELEQAIERSPATPSPEIVEEIGDLLFALVNLSRHLGADPEGVLAATNRKFRRRFAFIERQLAAAGQHLGETDLADLNRLWEQAKQLEEQPG